MFVFKKFVADRVRMQHVLIPKFIIKTVFANDYERSAKRGAKFFLK